MREITINGRRIPDYERILIFNYLDILVERIPKIPDASHMTGMYDRADRLRGYAKEVRSILRGDTDA